MVVVSTLPVADAPPSPLESTTPSSVLVSLDVVPCGGAASPHQPSSTSVSGVHLGSSGTSSTTSGSTTA
jgi:hypothetical protein